VATALPRCPPALLRVRLLGSVPTVVPSCSVQRPSSKPCFPPALVARSAGRPQLPFHGDGCVGAYVGASNHNHTTPRPWPAPHDAAVGAAAPEGVWRGDAVEQEPGCAESETSSRTGNQNHVPVRGSYACAHGRAEGGSPFRGRSREMRSFVVMNMSTMVCGGSIEVQVLNFSRLSRSRVGGSYPPPSSKEKDEIERF
jgi:hypothetical protein